LCGKILQGKCFNGHGHAFFLLHKAANKNDKNTEFFPDWAWIFSFYFQGLSTVDFNRNLAPLTRPRVQWLFKTTGTTSAIAGHLFSGPFWLVTMCKTTMPHEYRYTALKRSLFNRYIVLCNDWNVRLRCYQSAMGHLVIVKKCICSGSIPILMHRPSHTHIQPTPLSTNFYK
jgi:hypothetical protein